MYLKRLFQKPATNVIGYSRSNQWVKCKTKPGVGLNRLVR